jgi:hypothetical protein
MKANKHILFLITLCNIDVYDEVTMTYMIEIGKWRSVIFRYCFVRDRNSFRGQPRKKKKKKKKPDEHDIFIIGAIIVFQNEACHSVG